MPRLGFRRSGSSGGSGVLGEGPGMFNNMQGLLGQAPGMGGGMAGNFAGSPGMFGAFGAQGNIDPVMQQRLQQISFRESQLAIASSLLSQQNQLMDTLGNYMPGGTMDYRSKRYGGDLRGPDIKRRRRDIGPHTGGDRGRISQYPDRDRNRSRDQDRDRRRPGSIDSPRHDRGRSDRRDSRHSGHKDDSDYDPAEPTGDDDELLVGDFDDMGEEEDFDAGHSGSRGLLNEESDEKSVYFCHACNTECFSDRNFTTHMKGSHHKLRMEELLNLHKQKSMQLMSRLKAEEHIRKIESNDRKIMRGFCKICDCEISMPYDRHKNMSLHKQRFQQVKRGCGWCEVYNFGNFSDVLKHRETEQHQRNKEKFDKRDGKRERRHDDRSSKHSDEKKTEDKDKKSEDGEKKTDDNENPEIDDEEKSTRGAEKESPYKAKREAEKSEDVVIPPYDPDVPRGQNYVIAVTGFFCKLCHKFYNNENAAKIIHCQTEAHYEKFEKALQAKIKKLKQKEDEAKAKAAEEATHSEEIDGKTTRHVESMILLTEGQALEDEDHLEEQEEEKEEILTEETIAKENAAISLETDEANNNIEESPEDQEESYDQALVDLTEEPELATVEGELKEGEEEEEEPEAPVTSSPGTVRGRGRARRGRGRKK